MKSKRLIGVLLLVIALVITQLPVPFVNAVNTTSDFQMQGTTLIKYLGSNSSVVIPDGITTIGSEAFADCDFIEAVSIPNSVVEIDDMAFSGCNSITTITLPDTTETLGTFVFYNCSELITMYFGDALTSIGEGIFVGCYNLEKVIISDNNTNFIRDNGYVYSEDYTKLYFLCPGSQEKIYEMPSTVSEISKYAFWGCENIEEVYLSTTMEEIPAYSFTNCTSLKKINFPYNITSIDMKAFAYCIGLTEVTIPISVKYIHPTAFDYCNFVTINEESGNYAISFFEENMERFHPTSYYTLEEELEDMDERESAEIETNDSDQAKILGSTHIVGGNAMVIVNGMSNTVVTGYNNLVEELFGTDWQNTFIKENRLVKAAFYGDEQLTAISLPSTLEKIEDFAFARSGLQQIMIPDSVEEIGYAAFYHCDQLEQIEINSNVTKIEAYAFDKTPWMDAFYLQNETDFLIVGDGVLIAYKGNTSDLYIPDEVKSIAAYAFNNHTEITDIYGGENLQYVDEFAFYGCNVSITKSEDNLNTNNSINKLYTVVETQQTITNTKYVMGKWILVFGLLISGIIFLSLKKKNIRNNE